MKKYSISFFILICIFVCVCCQNSVQTETKIAEQTSSTFSVWNSMLYAEVEKSLSSVFPNKTEEILFTGFVRATITASKRYGKKVL